MQKLYEMSPDSVTPVVGDGKNVAHDEHRQNQARGKPSGNRIGQQDYGQYAHAGTPVFVNPIMNALTSRIVHPVQSSSIMAGRVA